MIARKRLDIRWRDLAFGLGACLWPVRATRDPFCDHQSLVCLSVRSGFDLLLGTLAMPAGSEVLVSAITIPAMPRILAEHGLVPVPVDLDLPTLSVRADALRAALTPRTKAILVAHLFGSRMDMAPVLAVAREHGLLVIEDCAQAFVGSTFKGRPESDVRMFSFGPIKTATALGGGVLFIREAALRAEMERRQAAYPRQTSGSFFRRLLLFSFFKFLLAPLPYALVVAAFRLFGRSHDDVVTGSGRSFGGPDFFVKIRHQPCTALRRLLSRRVGSYPAARIEERTASGREVLAALPEGLVLGGAAAAHTFWLFPIVCDAPEECMHRLWRAGFDAARGASSLCVVEPPPDRPQMRAAAAAAAMSRVLYLPVYAAVPPSRRQRLAELLRS